MVLQEKTKKKKRCPVNADNSDLYNGNEDNTTDNKEEKDKVVEDNGHRNGAD